VKCNCLHFVEGSGVGIGVTRKGLEGSGVGIGVVRKGLV